MTCENIKTADELFGKLPKLSKNDDAMNMPKVLLLTHTDLDGEGAYMMLQNCRSLYDIEVRRLSNSTMSFEIGKVFMDNESANYDFIIASDISCSEKVCKIISNYADTKKFVILDHHMTSDYLNKFPFAVCQSAIVSDSFTTGFFDKKLRDKKGEQLHSSGTSLMYDYLNYCGLYDEVDDMKKLIVGQLAHIIRCYDTWDWHNHLNDWEICNDMDVLFNAYGAAGFVKKVNLNMYKYMHIGRQYLAIYSIVAEVNDVYFDDNDKFVIECEKEKADAYIKSIERAFMTGNLWVEDKDGNTVYYSAVYVSSNRYIQEVSEYMKNKFTDADIYIVNYGCGLSFRTQKNNINLSEVVKTWNGGGHAGAAGVKIPSDKVVQFICSDVLGDHLILDEK